MSLNNIIIREIKLEDANNISSIYNTITGKNHKIDFHKVIKELVHNGGHASFVAESDGVVVGHMISYILHGGFGIDKSAWIANFGVDPRFMGQGIGKKLAEKIFLFYKKQGIKHIYTSVEWDSTDLLSFFKTLGFERSDVINLGKVIE